MHDLNSWKCGDDVPLHPDTRGKCWPPQTAGGRPTQGTTWRHTIQHLDSISRNNSKCLVFNAITWTKVIYEDPTTHNKVNNPYFHVPRWSYFLYLSILYMLYYTVQNYIILLLFTCMLESLCV